MASDIATVFSRTFELSMQIERERFLRAGSFELAGERGGYANGHKSKRNDTPAGPDTVDVPKTAGHDGAQHDAGSAAMVRAIVAIAQGTETKAQSCSLTTMSTVREVKGHYCSEPVPARKAESLLRRDRIEAAAGHDFAAFMELVANRGTPQRSAACRRGWTIFSQSL